MKIGFIQFAPKIGNKKYNLTKIESLASTIKTDLLVLPELCTTGYMFKNIKELENLAEKIPGPTSAQLTKIARKNKCYLIVGMPEFLGGKIFNTAIVVSPRGVIAKRQKIHLFMKEKLLFAEGKTKPKVFSWKNKKIGLGVCYDYMFPEFWRNLALQKADLFCNIANFVSNYGFRMMQARSIENGVFSVTVNRTGKERGQKFRGESEIVDNRGNIVKKAGKSEKAYVVNLNLSKSRDKKWKNKYNDLIKDRRPEMYN